MPDKVAGHLEVGTNGAGEVVLNHPKMMVDEKGVGYISFSPAQARNLARILEEKAEQAEGERN
jgi:hypothetical protein